MRINTSKSKYHFFDYKTINIILKLDKKEKWSILKNIYN